MRSTSVSYIEKHWGSLEKSDVNNVIWDVFILYYLQQKFWQDSLVLLNKVLLKPQSEAEVIFFLSSTLPNSYLVRIQAI